ncbi:uncharacterized protein V2V93DRAFT_374629 [Kockiozyma suomiensis]|uniref:uncharacterized protein n=1 Tax=Kockiozyma suomiensis TaxID=1337062 RepID=UPI0033430258
MSLWRTLRLRGNSCRRHRCFIQTLNECSNTRREVSIQAVANSEIQSEVSQHQHKNIPSYWSTIDDVEHTAPQRQSFSRESYESVKSRNKRLHETLNQWPEDWTQNEKLIGILQDSYLESEVVSPLVSAADVARYNSLLDLCREISSNLPEIEKEIESRRLYYESLEQFPEDDVLKPCDHMPSFVKKMRTERQTELLQDDSDSGYYFPQDIRNMVSSDTRMQSLSNETLDLFKRCLRYILQISPLNPEKSSLDFHDEELLKSLEIQPIPIFRHRRIRTDPLPIHPKEFTEATFIKYLHEIVYYEYASENASKRFGNVSDILFQLFSSNNLETLHLTSTLSFNYAILYFSETRSPRQAIQFLNRMIDRGISPNTTTFNYILKSCIRKQNLFLAAKVLKLMEGLSIPADRNTWTLLLKITPGPRLKVEIIKQMLFQGYTMDDAMIQSFFMEAAPYLSQTRIMWAIQNRFADICGLKTLHPIIDWLAKRRIFSAYYLLKRMIALRKLQPTTTTLNILLKRMSGLQRPDWMFGIVGLMTQHYNVSLDALSYHFLIRGVIKTGMHSNSNTVLEMLYGRMRMQGLAMLEQTALQMMRAQLWFKFIERDLELLKLPEAPKAAKLRPVSTPMIRVKPGNLYSKSPFTYNLKSSLDSSGPQEYLWQACMKHLAWPRFGEPSLRTITRQKRLRHIGWKDRYAVSRALGVRPLWYDEFRYSRFDPATERSCFLPLPDEKMPRDHWRGWNPDHHALSRILKDADAQFKRNLKQRIAEMNDERERRYRNAMRAGEKAGNQALRGLRRVYKKRDVKWDSEE